MQNPSKSSFFNRFLARLGWILVSLLGIVAVGFGYIFFNQDAIVGLVVGQVNKQIAVPIKVSKISLDWFSHFPSAAVRLDNVVVMGSDTSLATRPDTLASLQSLAFQIDLWKAFKGQVEIEGLAIAQGKISIKIGSKGQGNYNIIKPSEAKSEAVSPFSLSNISIKQVLFKYQTLANNPFAASAQIGQLAGTISRNSNGSLAITSNGAFQWQYLQIRERQYFKQMPSSIRASFQFLPSGRYVFQNAALGLGKAIFNVDGYYQPNQGRDTYAIKLKASNASISTLAVFLPPASRIYLDRYQTTGNVYAEAEIAKVNSNSQLPSINAKFGFSNASFFEPTQKLRISQATLSGRFRTPEGNTLGKGLLTLHNFKGFVFGKQFSGRATIANLQAPDVEGSFLGEIPFAFVLPFFSMPSLSAPSGSLAVAVDGKWQHGANIERIEGSIQALNLGLLAKKGKLPISNLNALLTISKRNLKISDLEVKVGSSDFAGNAFINRGLDFLLGTAKTPTLELDLKSKLLNLNELLEADANTGTIDSKSTGGKAEDYKFAIPQDLIAGLDIDVTNLKFRKLVLRNTTGHVTLNRAILGFSNLKSSCAGGSIQLSGNTNTSVQSKIASTIAFRAEHLLLDSLFYEMENFNQAFVVSRQIKGTMNTSGNVAFAMDQALSVDPNSVLASFNLHINNGVLHAFEPAMAMHKYIDQHELQYLQFQDLDNHFTIQNQKISIPPMEIKSNALAFTISGSHTFKQEMDYKIKVPLRYIKTTFQLAKTDNGSALNGNLFLAVKGVPGKIDVRLDKAATVAKLVENLKEEKKVFADLFKRKKTEVGTQKDAEQPKNAETEPAFFDFD